MDVGKDVIGIVGGMGSYATLNIFERLLNAFEAKKEWERPRIIIDNYCTLPSRSRAILYNERRETVVKGLAESVKNLINCGANYIILGSNTAHLFLSDIIQLVPESEKFIVNIIEKCAKDVKDKAINEVVLLGTDATVDLGKYQSVFADYGISIKTPSAEKQKEVVGFIEEVKQNTATENTYTKFASFMNGLQGSAIVLGCTELPVLYEKCVKGKLAIGKRIFDPIDSVIKFLKEG